MADVVQYRLERMVDELDDLERRGLFTRREIAEIVKQRRKYEYRLKRPSPLKEDFIAYIDYETQLDALRRLRKKKVTRELAAEGKKKSKKRKSVSDFAPISRILEIYRLAVTRFKGDVELWFKYLEFCRQRKNGRMKKVLVQVMRFHPKVPGVWIYAAAWEFDQNLNVAAARALMQSGLRMCPSSEDLWVEYLRMELTYLNKLKARKVALGEDKGSLVRASKDPAEEQWREQNEDLFVSLDDNKEHKGTSDEKSEMKLDLFSEHGASVFTTIYKGAVEAIPSSFSLRKRFLEIVEALNISNVEDMHKEIVSDMKKDFSADPQYWDWLARLEISSPINASDIIEDVKFAQLKKAVEVYEEATNVVRSTPMFKLYVEFLIDAIRSHIGESQDSGHSDNTLSYISGHTQTVFDKAERMGCLSGELAFKYVSFLFQIGKVDEARKLAEKLCSGRLSDSGKLQLLRVSMEVECITKHSHSLNKCEIRSIYELVEGVLSKMPVSEAESLWLLVLKSFAHEKKYFKKLVELGLLAVAKFGVGDVGFSLPSAIINSAVQNDGIQQAREVYKRFLALPHPGLALYRTCIELESNLASLGDKDCCLMNCRKLYEAALSTYSQDVSLWQDYYNMEVKLGTSETCAGVCWRARKTVKDSAVVFAPTRSL